MKTFPHFGLALTTIAATSLLAGGLAAQWTYRGGGNTIGGGSASTKYDVNVAKSHSKSYGNEWLGGSYSFYTAIRRKKDGFYELARMEARGQARLRFLKMSREAAYARAYGYAERRGTASSPSNKAYGNLTMRLAGITVMNRTIGGTTSLPAWSKTWDLFPVDIRYGFGLGPVSLQLKGNVGVGVKRNLYYAFGTTETSINAAGSLEAWGYGRASLSAGIAGVTATADFAKTKLGASIGVSIRRGFQSLVTLDVTAFRLRLKAWVDFWLKSYSKTFVDVSYGRVFATILRVGL